MRLLFLAVVVVMSAHAHAEPPPVQSFKHLHQIKLPEGSIFVDKQSIEVVAKPIKGYGGDALLACRFQREGENFKVIFHQGESDDPTFVIQGDKGTSADFHGTELYLPGGPSLYVSGWTNSYFNHRRKFTFKGGSITEVEQPFHYVGLKSRVKRPEHLQDEKKTVTVTLYRDKSKSAVVARLGVGSEIEVLLADGPKWYLVRTSFGLVGWVPFDSAARDSAIGIGYAGD